MSRHETTLPHGLTTTLIPSALERLSLFEPKHHMELESIKKIQLSVTNFASFLKVAGKIRDVIEPLLQAQSSKNIWMNHRSVLVESKGGKQGDVNALQFRSYEGIVVSITDLDHVLVELDAIVQSQRVYQF